MNTCLHERMYDKSWAGVVVCVDCGTVIKIVNGNCTDDLEGYRDLANGRRIMDSELYYELEDSVLDMMNLKDKTGWTSYLSRYCCIEYMMSRSTEDIVDWGVLVGDVGYYITESGKTLLDDTNV